MTRTPESLLDIFHERLDAARISLEECLRHSTQIIVFGSFAVGLQHPASDIDVLCIGKLDARLKTRTLDFLAISESQSATRLWQGGELAGHIHAYGVWLRGASVRVTFNGYSEESVQHKKRRVLAFARRLPTAWGELDSDFKTKYSLKLRREVQRLIRLESAEPIPPTRLLDSVPTQAPERSAVYYRLQEAFDRHNRRFARTFLESVEREWHSDAVVLTSRGGQF